MSCHALPWVCDSPLHALPLCLWSACLCTRVCSPCAFEVCVHPGPCVFPLMPPCPPRETQELRLGARWASPRASWCAWREASGHTRPRLDPPPGAARGGGRGRRRRRGARARHRDRQAGGREAVAAGSSRRRSPAAPSPCPRPGEPSPSPGAAEMQFPVPAPWLRGLFRAGFGNKRGHAAAAQNEVSAGAGGPGTARGEGELRGGTAARPGRSPLAHLLVAGGADAPASAARPSIVAAAGEGGRGGPGGISASRLPGAGAREGPDSPKGRPSSPRARVAGGEVEGGQRCPRGAGMLHGGIGTAAPGPTDT